jgi:hypothetical protein
MSNWEYQREIEEARLMIKAFVSVGCTAFDLSETTIDDGLVSFRAGRNILAMQDTILPYFIPLVWQRKENLIVRPRMPFPDVLAQLDDIGGVQFGRMISSGFLTVETSPGSFQIWIAISGADEIFVRRLIKGVGADVGANGAVRMAGSPNCKPRYAPKFPEVRIIDMELGRIETRENLEDLAAPVDSVRTAHPNPVGCPVIQNRGWPDYAGCLAGAPDRKNGKGADRSRVDYLWTKWALERGNSPESVGEKLLEVSEKAREEFDRGNNDYVFRTVRAAMHAR